ncbi:MAG: M28 family peptidase [Cyclobacteriaceae bacterium]
MTKAKKILSIGLITLILYGGCNTSTRTLEKESPIKKQRTFTVPAFNSDSAYFFIEKQVSFGPRVPNTENHKLCGEYLVNQLKNYGAKVIEQDFTERIWDDRVLELKNIIGSFNPNAQKRILLAAHWDTRPFADKDTLNKHAPFDGANDGASGVGVLLEIARVLQISEAPDVGIDIIFFDGEDYGEHEDADKVPFRDGKMKIWWCLGSQYWSLNLHEPRYSAYFGVLLDMVGAKSAKFYREGGSMQFAPKVVRKVWNTARDLGHGAYFINENSPGITDDHIFVNRDAKIPMINIVDYDPESKNYYFPNYHHTHRDNLDIIDRQTLQAVGETLMYVIYNE